MRVAPVIQILLVVATGVGYALRWWRKPERRARRKLALFKERKIAEFQDGELARVCGTVGGAANALASPLTERPCIAFRYVIESMVDSQWAPVLSAADCLSFTINDGSGDARVEGPFMIGLDDDDRGGSVANPPPGLYQLQEKHNIRRETRFGGDIEFRFREAIVKPGERISVLGRMTVMVDPTGSKAALRGPPVVRVIQGRDGDPVVLADIADEE